ncbi:MULTISPECIES: hypothetical protein [unclassified Coleofasciculus]|uniref:hypothetical protein n=1 Tax=unclassified Coleofasciculus TaxID=2692782 RepID=UPI00187DF0B8|nr:MULTISPECIES: hypothetical protein [unclassified Coleofasciculus]MBE9125815.1 hypothetical protein [Coleofasciculus sp. LEGE 07081]MBE9149000.1 hypothetical protein [Coleofasciculus sp. LEGE 07092]
MSAMQTNLVKLISKITVYKNVVLKNPLLKTVLIIFLIATIGISTVGHYGISWDEPLYIKHVLWNYESIRKKQPLQTNPSNLKYYGVVLDVAAESLFQLKHGLSSHIQVNAERVFFKHLLTFLFSLFAYVSVAGIVGILCGSNYAWIGPLVLALLPRFWGHSFFNPKDIPFATLFALSTWLSAYIVSQYSKLHRVIKFGFNRICITTILFGILVGLLTSARIGGFVFLAFVPFTYILLKLEERQITRYTFKNIAIGWILIVIPWAIVTTVCHPASWSNPVRWFFENVKYNSQHAWGGTVLFDGQFIPGHQLPWFYLPRWITMTVPEMLQILFLLGLGLSLYKYSKFSVLQKSCFILVFLQVFSLPLYAILKGSTLYDGVRQFLFILPGIAAIAASSIGWLYQHLFNSKIIRLFFVALIFSLFLQVSSDMAKIHPYEYIYFNRLSGGLTGAVGRYETDYWGLSIREAMEWINKNSQAGTQVLVAGPVESARVFAKSDSPVIGILNPKGKIEIPNIPKPYYYLAVPKWELQEAFPECQDAYKVVKQGVPLTIVKLCN